MSDLNFPNLWIAILDSSLSDEQRNRVKTIKICQFARTCSMFLLKKIIIYHYNTTNNDIKDNYWGYEVQETYNLNKLLESTSNTQIIITSKNGGYVKDNEAKILARLKSFRNLLIVFGTPKKGVDEMLAAEGRRIDA